MTLIEIVLALVIFLVGALVLFRAFGANRKLSVQNRDRTAAQILMGNLLEEVRAHPFGHPAPSDWPDDSPPTGEWESSGFPKVQEIPTSVEGRRQKMEFFRQMAYEGSLVGSGSGKTYDLVTITFSWKDPGHPSLKTLEARMVVHNR